MSQEEIKGCVGRQNQALIRYLAVLFGVAFIMVLVSFLLNVRGSRQDLSQITQSANSALTRAEQLQDANRLLSGENEELRQQLQAVAADSLDMEKEVVEAYELLTQALVAKEAGDQKELQSLLDSLESRAYLLNDEGQMLYEALSGANR